ncbi:DUF4232 domain-containing protein [Curtobacterium flaccumfaciens]|uniref:DUF4232 domain-containing protein n=1 Tax=Curtobacterium flaccumfaciens TaxID=2035 RepID=UPI001375A624|nr:DUF4232 domain-containing protein [Curtobacterium flaccumfaciens]
MTTARVSTILPTILITTMAVLLTGCSGGGTGTTASEESANSATPTSSPTTHVVTPSKTTAPTATPAAGSTSAPTSIQSSAGTAGAKSNGAAAPATAPGARCATAQLSGSIGDGGGSSAGAQRVAIILHNTGANSCTLQGWPGISFVGGHNGTQIGNAATLDRATAHQTLPLRPGGEVQAIVTVRQAGDWDSATCHPSVTDGFRVIPPGSTQSLFVGATGSLFEACASTNVHQLTTSALASF